MKNSISEIKMCREEAGIDPSWTIEDVLTDESNSQRIAWREYGILVQLSSISLHGRETCLVGI